MRGSRGESERGKKRKKAREGVREGVRVLEWISRCFVLSDPHVPDPDVRVVC